MFPKCMPAVAIKRQMANLAVILAIPLMESQLRKTRLIFTAQDASIVMSRRDINALKVNHRDDPLMIPVLSVTCLDSMRIMFLTLRRQITALFEFDLESQSQKLKEYDLRSSEMVPR